MAIKKPNNAASAYGGSSTLIQPSTGSRLYQDELGTIYLLGQPPKVLKGYFSTALAISTTSSFLM